MSHLREWTIIVLTFLGSVAHKALWFVVLMCIRGLVLAYSVADAVRVTLHHPDEKVWLHAFAVLRLLLKWWGKR
jgi:hypothetical protein